MSRVVVIATAYTLMQFCAFCIGAPKSKLPKDVEELLSWLPLDTESVIIYQPKETKRTPSTAPDEMLAKSLDHWTKLARGPVELVDTKLAEVYQDAQVGVLISAARNFRRPSGIGPAPYEGCHISHFIESQKARFERLKEHLRARCETAVVEGEECFLVRTKVEADVWSLIVTFLDEKTIALATDVEFLRELLRRRAGPHDGSAFPPDLPQWKEINLAHSYWGLRRFDTALRDIEAKAVAIQTEIAIGIQDVEAIGVAFSFDPTETAAPEASYLSRNKDLTNLFEQDFKLPVRQFKIETMPNGLRVVRLSFCTDSKEELLVTILIIRAMLGHGVLL